ncbi:DUF6308 family protein [Luteococcus sp. Sow4_B9]|uniref:DUF6308 family protein n=1 Tax=Luteococcus sp. Sow4_B9 TaxID=3438792 RepID=UPI003F9C376F
MNSEWWTPNDAVNARAVVRARRAVSSPDAPEDLARYYAVDGNYAGATFTTLEGNDPHRITPADLLAITTLSVSVSPRGIRRFESNDGADFLRNLDEQWDLGDEDAEAHAESMGALYSFVKERLEGNKWVTASKICARKRPKLFPVRDTVVSQYLGLTMQANEDWPAFAAIMRDKETLDALAQAVAGAQRPGVDLGEETPMLRHLDVVLWMAGLREGRTA